MVKIRDVRNDKSGEVAAAINAGRAEPAEYFGSVVGYFVPASWLKGEPDKSELIPFRELKTGLVIAWFVENVRRGAEGEPVVSIPLSMSKEGKRSGGGRVHRGWLVPATRAWERRAESDD